MINPGTTHHNRQTSTGHHRRTTPNNKPGIRSWHLRIISRKETIHLNQRNHPRDNPDQPPTPTNRADNQPEPPRRRGKTLASTFGTLLSSQGTDAHPQPHRFRSRLIGGNPSSLGLPILPVKLTHELDVPFRRARPGRHRRKRCPSRRIPFPRYSRRVPVETPGHSGLRAPMIRPASTRMIWKSPRQSSRGRSPGRRMTRRRANGRFFRGWPPRPDRPPLGVRSSLPGDHEDSRNDPAASQIGPWVSPAPSGDGAGRRKA
jgi:hypothetical protein